MPYGGASGYAVENNCGFRIERPGQRVLGTCTGGSQVSISYVYRLLYAIPLTISSKSCYPNWS